MDPGQALMIGGLSARVGGSLCGVLSEPPLESLWEVVWEPAQDV